MPDWQLTGLQPNKRSVACNDILGTNCGVLVIVNGSAHGNQAPTHFGGIGRLVRSAFALPIAFQTPAATASADVATNVPATNHAARRAMAAIDTDLIFTPRTP